MHSKTIRQKDRYRGTGGAKEGCSSKIAYLVYFSPFLSDFEKWNDKFGPLHLIVYKSI